MARNGRGRGKKRGRPAKKIVDKADVVEMKAVGELGFTPIEIVDDDYDMHMRSFVTAVENQKIAKNAYDRCCKAAKKVSDKFLELCKLGLKWKGKSAEEHAQLMQMHGYILKRSGSNVQLTLHNILLGDAVETAYKRGFDQGFGGMANDNRYPSGSDLAERHDLGWGEGQKKLVENGNKATPEGSNSGAALPL